MLVVSVAIVEQMEDEPWVAFEAIIATTHRVEKYGGLAFADSALAQIVEGLNTGRLPMLRNHDWTKPIRTKDVEASIVTLNDGERAVRLTGLVVQSDWEAVGHIGGMSFSTTEPIGRADGLRADYPALTLCADAGWFGDETIGQACSIMSELAPVNGSRLLQFTAVDDARVILEMAYTVVISLGPGLATSAVWDGIKYLLVGRRTRSIEGTVSPTRIELVTPLPAGDVIAIIDTSDPDVVSRALAAYSRAVDTAAQAGGPGRQVVVWREETGQGNWHPPA